MLFETWERLLDIYSETSRLAILRKQGKIKVFWESMAIYGFVSLFSIALVVMLPALFIVSALWIFITAIIINYRLNMLFVPLERKKKRYISMNGYGQYGRYKFFRESVRHNMPDVIEKLPQLIQWHEVRFQRYQRINPMTHPILAGTVISAIGLLSASDIVAQNAVTISILVLTLLFVIAILLDAILDFWFRKERTAFEVSRLLQWMLLEKEAEVAFSKNNDD